jgi:hypothetical protein
MYSLPQSSECPCPYPQQCVCCEQVIVGKQASNVFDSALTSYGPPVITSVSRISPLSHEVPTAGGVLIAIIGHNFGSAFEAAHLTWNGDRVSTVTIPGPHSRIEFVSLNGDDPSITLELTVGGQSCTSTGQV